MKIDFSKLREQFIGKRIRVTSPTMMSVGICTDIDQLAEDRIEIFLDRKRFGNFCPTYITSQSISCRGVKAEIDLSIADAHAYRLELEAQAKERTDLIALQLSQVIPESLRAFAEDWRFISPNVKDPTVGWALPAFIEKWIESTLLGKESFVSVYPSDREKYGFADFEDAKKKLRPLIRAWKSALHIRLYEHEHEGQIVELRLCIKVKGIKSK